MAGGSASSEYFPYQCALALAKELGTQIVDFPGNHIGYVVAPEEFASQLLSVLEQ